MTKRQHNHSVKVYYEKWFKKHPGEEKNPDGYKVIPWYKPQGKRESRKFHLFDLMPKQLLVWYKDNPYVHFGKVTFYINFEEGCLQNMNSGEVFKYDSSLGAYLPVSDDSIRKGD